MAFISQRGPLIILRIEWVLFALALIAFIATIITAGVLSPTISRGLAQEVCELCTDDNQNNWDDYIDEDHGKSMFIVALVTFGFMGLVYLVIHCALNILLRNGLREENRKKCLNWMLIHGVLMILGVLITFSNIVKGGKTAVGGLATILAWIYRILSIFIVKKYTDTLKCSEEELPGYGNENSNATTMTEIPL